MLFKVFRYVLFEAVFLAKVPASTMGKILRHPLESISGSFFMARFSRLF